MASNSNNLAAPTAAQRLQAASPGAGLKPSASRGYLLPDNGQEQVQAIDFALSNCARRAARGVWHVPRLPRALTPSRPVPADDGEDGQQDDNLIHCPTLRAELVARCAAASAASAASAACTAPFGQPAALRHSSSDAWLLISQHKPSALPACPPSCWAVPHLLYRTFLPQPGLPGASAAAAGPRPS